MKKIVGLFLTISICAIATAFDSATHLSYSKTVGCAEFRPRDDGGDVGFWVHNMCGRNITFVIYTDDGMDYLNMSPGQARNWTVDGWNRSKTCNGWSVTDC
jgi:hypothetical protein